MKFTENSYWSQSEKISFLKIHFESVLKLPNLRCDNRMSLLELI